MKWVRAVFLTDPLVILATMFFGSLSLLVSFFDKTGRRQIAVGRFWARFLLGLSGIRVRVSGLERIAPGGSYIFVTNHLSYMDTPVMLAYIPVQFRFLAKRGLFKVPFLGQHLSRGGHIPVPLEDPRAAVKTLQRAAQVIQAKKISLLIFPEGGRSQDGVLQPFKEGAAYIAIRAGVPIVPVVLRGTREVLPFGSGVVRAGLVDLHVLEPIDTRGMALKERGRLTERLRGLILGELEGERETGGSVHAQKPLGTESPVPEHRASYSEHEN
ncbi:MAG TPA: lysophospholipid acyltransferase family protein [Bryobacteraceae bacterium]